MMLSVTDFVKRLPSSLEKTIAKQWGQQVNPAGNEYESETAKGETGSTVRNAIFIPGEGINEAEVRLEAWERLAMETIFRKFGLRPFEWAGLEREGAKEGISGAELARGLHGLRSKGILFAFSRTWGEPVFAMPLETATVWHNLIWPQASVSKQESDSFTTKHSLLRNSGIEAGTQQRDVLFDMLFLLRYIAANDIRLTRGGTVPKRHLTQWIGLMTTQPECFRSLSLQYVHCDVYPDNVALIYDQLLRLGLVHNTGEALILNRDIVESWLSLSTDEMRRVLYAAWKKVSFSSLPAWLHNAALLMERLPVHGWTPWSSLLSWLEHNRMVEVESASQRTLLAEEAYNLWLWPMEELGWLETVRSSEDELSLRLAAPLFSDQEDHQESNGQGTCYVQPDYEVIVPPGIPPKVHWLIDAMAERRVSDQVDIYRLTRKSLQQAATEGYSSEDCLRFLKTIAKAGMPDNVEQMILQWGNQAAQSAVDDSGEGKAILCSRLSMETGFSSAAVTSFHEKADAQGIMMTDYYWSSWPVDAEIPADDELFPGWRDIPVKWYKQCLRYHRSTYKELIRQAIAWRTLIRITEAGEELQLLPLSIRETGVEWLVIGVSRGRELTLDPSGWEGIQIILPGIS